MARSSPRARSRRPRGGGFSRAGRAPAPPTPAPLPHGVQQDPAARVTAGFGVPETTVDLDETVGGVESEAGRDLGRDVDLGVRRAPLPDGPGDRARGFAVVRRGPEETAHLPVESQEGGAVAHDGPFRLEGGRVGESMSGAACERPEDVDGQGALEVEVTVGDPER